MTGTVYREWFKEVWDQGACGQPRSSGVSTADAHGTLWKYIWWHTAVWKADKWMAESRAIGALFWRVCWRRQDLRRARRTIFTLAEKMGVKDGKEGHVPLGAERTRGQVWVWGEPVSAKVQEENAIPVNYGCALQSAGLG